MPGSRKKTIQDKKKFPLWIPIAVVLLTAGVLLYLFWWPVPVEEAYELKLHTESLRLTIEDGVRDEQILEYSLEPLNRLLALRAGKAYEETSLTWTSADPAVAAVDENGRVKAVEKGKTTLTGRFGTLTVSCPVEVYYPLKGLAISREELILQKGEEASLSCLILPEQAETPSLRWTSSNDAVVSADASGRIHAFSVGTAQISVSGGGFTESCTVTVLSAMEGIGLTVPAGEMNVGEEMLLSLRFFPTDTTDDKTARWESSDPAVASVGESGIVTAHAPGETTLSVTVGAFREEAALTVYAPLKGISFAEEELRLEKGESAQLTVLFDPENTTDDTAVRYASSDEGMVSVDENGLVTAREAGIAFITAQVGDWEASCVVTVRVPMTGILIDGKNRTLERGDTAQLTVSYFPEDTNDDRTLVWTSDDPAVAEVDENGLVSAVGPGETLITAACGDFSDQVRITVKVPAKEVVLSLNGLSMAKGESYELSATVLPEDTTEGQSVEWSSSDPSVAWVDENGRVNAVGGGSCTIYAVHGSLWAACEVDVTVPMTGISLNRSDVTLTAGDTLSLSVSFEPWDTTDDKTVSWSSSDESIASVSGGTVRTYGAGTCTITASAGGHTASMILRVKPLIRVSSVALSQYSVYFSNWGQNVTLYAAVFPEDATYPSVSWSSSDPSVATVDGSGTVKVSGSGSCTITATADGVSASCQVTASLPPPTIVIVLDPGHNSRWNGASVEWGGETVREEDLTLATAYACKYYLETYYRNVAVYLTRYSNDDISSGSSQDADLQARAAYAKQKGADLVVSMHYNSGGASGVEVYATLDSRFASASWSLAERILAQITGRGYPDRGVRTREFEPGWSLDYYGILRYCAEKGIMSVLVEHCFMDNYEDFYRMGWSVSDLTNGMGVADAIGIANYLGLQKK